MDKEEIINRLTEIEKMICELKDEVEYMEDNSNDNQDELKNRIEELERQLIDCNREKLVIQKALNLACEDLQFFDYGIETKEQGIEMKENYFIEQAKENKLC